MIQIARRWIEHSSRCLALVAHRAQRDCDRCLVVDMVTPAPAGRNTESAKSLDELCLDLKLQANVGPLPPAHTTGRCLPRAALRLCPSSARAHHRSAKGAIHPQATDAIFGIKLWCQDVESAADAGGHECTTECRDAVIAFEYPPPAPSAPGALCPRRTLRSTAQRSAS